MKSFLVFELLHFCLFLPPHIFVIVLMFLYNINSSLIYIYLYLTLICRTKMSDNEVSSPQTDTVAEPSPVEKTKKSEYIVCSFLSTMWTV